MVMKEENKDARKDLLDTQMETSVILHGKMELVFINNIFFLLDKI
jgi:hypothetical protein